MNTVDILAIWAHPDDIELSCGWTLLKHRKAWYTIGLCDLTQGELGTNGTAAIRSEEAEQARVNLWAERRVNLSMPDGFFNHSKENLLKLVTIIRQAQPAIIFANAPTDRHPDHGRASTLVKEACFLAWLAKIEDGNEPHRPRSLYFYVQDRYLAPDFVVDISEQYEEKIQLIQCYASQVWTWESKEEESTTPISSKAFLESIWAKNRIRGREIGVAYAEGFIAERVVGVGDVMELE